MLPAEEYMGASLDGELEDEAQPSEQKHYSEMDPQRDQLQRRSAQFFYDAYYNRLTELNWKDFWAGFAEIVLTDGVYPTKTLEKEIEKLTKCDMTGLVTLEQLDECFRLWEDEGKRKEVVDRSKLEHYLKYLLGCSQQVYPRNLVLKLIKTNENFPFDFALNDLIVICAQGLVNSKRNARDGVTRFGYLSGSINDVNFNPDDPDLNTNLFQILSCSDGYYAVDCSNVGAVSVRLVPDVPAELRKGSFIMVGSNIFLEVEECVTGQRKVEPDELYAFEEDKLDDLPFIRISVNKGERLGEVFDFCPSEDCNEFVIGIRSVSNPKYIEFSDTSVSRSHARISFSNGKWLVTDLKSSNGTWHNLVNKKDSEKNVPSRPVKLKAGDVVAVQYYRFEVVQA